ncbi:catalase [Amycolatopsis sp. PS_44_ISF1]|uniref:catalase n=1 Tax=Amycolatopsis sp. PS_44_ISF1 TaxID=2974917 RepID=UPI0028DFB5A7|nr:catalase [Amycolatopsis sp. PS_44_ISF1]MDT8912909.1 catalase [Amycolatopsis sp. PS_44_ISF1]
MTESQRPPTTTDAGIPVESDEHSLTVGPGGPILLQDHYLIEQMAQFNRERVPERQPHAKGSGAFGRFEVTGDVSAFTKAAVFQPGAKTELVARFSTVAGERGSPDTWRDPRGFALKFYTTEGVYDMVGNNTPVFFVKDPMKFQHFIRSQKRRADNNLRDHDMQWDFWTLSPESAHQVTWLMGDRGIPRTWRHMNGYSSHTYLWINADGERHWVKYHFKTDQGLEYFTQHEADQMAAADTDYHTRDLFEAIERGDHPSWTLHVQLMPFSDAEQYRFNPFDLTKVWPHADYPLIEVGRMTLDRNPTDHHAEIEQAAFEPNNLVPGIGASPDRMLLGRLFAYADAHRYRIGANYKQLPVNASTSPVHSYSKDGAMRFTKVSDPVYAPNSKGGPQADTARYGSPASWHADGEIVRSAYVDHAEDDDWGQAGTLVREVLDDDARTRLVDNIVGHLLNAVSEPVLQRAFEYWRQVDKDLGDRIESGVREKAGGKDPKKAEQGNPARSSMQHKA